MKKPSPLSIVIAVTGHRDIDANDEPRLEETVRSILSGLQQRYAATTLALLSPLAEGADQLVARVALDLGMRLFVPLPMPQHDYEKAFESTESAQQFRTLLAQADKHFELPALQGLDNDGRQRDMKYAAVGAYIARHSQILIALWDGVPSDKMGGTAQVVDFKLQGVPEGLAPPRSVLDPVESGPVYHVVTPRLSNPDVVGVPFELRKLFPKTPGSARNTERAYDRIYRRMDAFNRDADKLNARLASKQQEEKDRLLSGPAAELLSTSQKTVFNRYGLASAMAARFQRLTTGALRCLLVLALLAALALNLHIFIDPGQRVLDYSYLVLLALAYGLFLWTYRGDFHNKYLDCRGLAEGLRVHLFWRLSGLRDSVADHYLRKQRDELDWIRQAIRVLSIPTKLEPDNEPLLPNPKRLQVVFEQWVKDQAVYFEKKSSQDGTMHAVFNSAGHVFFLVSLFLAIMKALPGTNPQIFFYITMTAVIGALMHIYAQSLALAEHAKQYQRMMIFYGNAAEHLQKCLALGEYEKAQSLIRDIGQEALAESGDWILLHRDRRPMVPKV